MDKVIDQVYSISIHVPAWGTTEGKDMAGDNFNISIHVPAWGTTSQERYEQLVALISIHVPAWGTTSYWHGKSEHGLDFNPRSRVGNDENGSS